MAFIPVFTTPLSNTTSTSFDTWLSTNYPTWTCIQGFADNRLNISPVGVVSSNTVDELYRTTGTYTANQFATLNLVAWAGTGGINLGLRSSGTSFAGGSTLNVISCTLRRDTTPYLQVKKLINSTLVPGSEISVNVPGFVPGDDITVGVFGSDVRVYRNGIQISFAAGIGYVTEPALATGTPAFGLYGTSGEVIVESLRIGDISEDVTLPILTGAILPYNILPTSYRLSWSAGSDNVAITGYELSLDAGVNWVKVGNVLETIVTGRTPGTTDQVRIRAYDLAENKSAPPISTNVLLPANVTYSATVGPFYYNTGSGPQLNLPVMWTAWMGGSVGSLTDYGQVNGTGTTNSVSGVLTLTGLPLTGPGIVLVRDNDGGVYYDHIVAA